MSRFAKSTVVPVSRTREEIIKTLTKYGATGFAFGESGGPHNSTHAVIMFEARSRRVKFVLPLPKDRTSKSGSQSERTRWRCLLLAIKSKLESTESGISSFENEFMAHIVMPNGLTVSENILPKIQEAYSSGTMPPLLGPGR